MLRRNWRSHWNPPQHFAATWRVRSKHLTVYLPSPYPLPAEGPQPPSQKSSTSTRIWPKCSFYLTPRGFKPATGRPQVGQKAKFCDSYTFSCAIPSTLGPGLAQGWLRMWLPLAPAGPSLAAYPPFRRPWAPGWPRGACRCGPGCPGWPRQGCGCGPSWHRLAQS